jgi:hypothetical protein
MKKLATLLSLIALLAVAVPVAAQARHGADDPVGHVRHGGDGRAGDDRRARQSTGTTTVTTAATTAAKAATNDGRGRGTDDAPGDDRGSHGSDDGPNHS